MQEYAEYGFHYAEKTVDKFILSLALFGIGVAVLLLYKPVRSACHHYREHCRICRSLDRARVRKEAQKEHLRHG